MPETKAAFLRWYFLFAAFVAGAVVLALEVLAARVMAPALGTGSLTWASLLAIALGSLALGNLLGGLSLRWRSFHRNVFWVLAMAAFIVVHFSWSYRELMEQAGRLSPVWGSLFAASSVQGFPLFALGFLTPLLIRKGEGKTWWAGAILACGTAGGMVGALGTGLWLLPSVGILRSYLVLALLLSAASLPGAFTESARTAMRVTAVFLFLLCLIAALVFLLNPAESNVVHSAYGQIEVREEDGSKILVIDGLPQAGVRAEVQPGSGFEHGYLLEAALMLRPGVRSALVIGLGGGLAARTLEAHGITVECVEIDPMVVKVAREEFGYDGPVIIADGRRFLEKTDRAWDLIFLDVCTSERLAYHLFTVEAFNLIKQRLTPGGVLAVQFIGGDGEWSASVLRTVASAFPNTLLLGPRSLFSPLIGPKWIFASESVFPAYSSVPPEQLPFALLHPETEGVILTDDRFRAERAWMEVANRWRSIYAMEE